MTRCDQLFFNWSVKRHGKSSSLHSKKIFWLGVADFLWLTSQVKWFWGHFGTCCPAWGPTARPKCFAEVFIGN